MLEEIQNHFPVFEIMKEYFFLFKLMLKSLPHQTFSVFIALYFVFKRSLFALKIASARNLEGCITSGSSTDHVSTHLGQTQLNRGIFFFISLLTSFSFLYPLASTSLGPNTNSVCYSAV